MTYSLLTKLNFATRHHCSVRIFATRDADWLAKFRKFNEKYFCARAARTVFRGSRNHTVTLRKKMADRVDYSAGLFNKSESSQQTFHDERIGVGCGDRTDRLPTTTDRRKPLRSGLGGPPYTGSTKAGVMDCAILL